MKSLTLFRLRPLTLPERETLTRDRAERLALRHRIAAMGVDEKGRSDLAGWTDDGLNRLLADVLRVEDGDDPALFSTDGCTVNERAR
jgi:hypothetical protein